MTNSSAKYVQDYVRVWGRLEWDRSELANAEVRADLLPIVRAVAEIEHYTRFEARKVLLSCLDRDDDVGTFIPLWVAEESEHGRALAALAKATFPSADFKERPGAFKRRLRALSHRPSTARLMGKVPGGALAFCVVGALAEHATIALYNYLAVNCGDQRAELLFRRIARQEGRHFAFYRSAALARASLGSPSTLAARAILSAAWRPVGVDYLGVDGYRRIFAPLIADRDFVDRVLRADSVIDGIPGLASLGLMQRYVTSLTT